MKFVDTARFTIESGKGGDGAVSFRHELYVPNGGPNGGDGGDGGDIIFVSDEGKSSLLDLKLRHEYEAQDGFKGDIKNMHGKDGKDMVLKVPVGTVLFNADTNEMIADFKENGQEEIVAKGGRGGRGECPFCQFKKQSTHYFWSRRSGNSN
jgi:GTP-binding protein